VRGVRTQRENAVNVQAKTLAHCCRMVASALQQCARALDEDARRTAPTGEELTAFDRVSANPYARRAVQVAAQEHGTSALEVVEGGTARHVVKARWLAWRILNKKMAANAIAKLFGADPSSVTYGLGKYKGDDVHIMIREGML
jgi:hypothetical protein